MKSIARLLRVVVRIGAVLAVAYALLGFFTARISAGPTTLLEVGSSPPTTAPGDLMPWRVDPASEPAARWIADRGVELRGAISVHSGRSHDAVGTLDDIADAAARAGLDFVVLGDHPSDWLEEAGALDPVVIGSTVLIPGQEMVLEGKGRALVVGLDADTLVQRWEGEVADLSARVSNVDGFISVVHARSPRGRERWQVGVDAPGVHAWESIDMSEVARLRLADRWAAYHITSFLAGLVTGTSHRPVLRLNREGASAPGLLAYDSARTRESLTLTAALNHHPKARILGRLVPSYAAFFRTYTNHVLVPEAPGSEPFLARTRVLDGLKAGRVYVSLGNAADATGFDFGLLPTTTEGAPTPMVDTSLVDTPMVDTPLDGSPPGSPLAPSPPATRPLAVRLPPEAPGRMIVRVVGNGVEQGWFSAAPGEIVAFRPPGVGAYRVEVYRAGLPLGSRRYGMSLWLLSNAVDVGPA